MENLLIVMVFFFTILNAIGQTNMTISVTKTINIKADPDKVWNYVNDLSKWPQWAIHNVRSSKQGDNGYWLMEGPRGTSKVKMNSDKSAGTLDHDFIDPGEGHWKVPCRVVAGNLGSHFMITFTKPEQMPDEAFEIGMKMLEEELAKLKEFVEKH
ncbi:MAG: SRPBCC family protein [Flammeovirgaceae bacterium]|nr:SRPBCC family protein [Flammeovirgaceae bacterium]